MSAPQPADSEYLPVLHPHHMARKRVRAAGHIVPAAMLVQGAILALRSGDPHWVRLLEFVIGAAYLLLFVREWRATRHPHPVHHPAAIEWLEFAAAGIAWLEAFHIWHAHHVAEQSRGVHHTHILPWLYAAVGAAYALLGLKAASLAARQGLRVTDTGFALRLLPLAPARKVQWQHLSHIVRAKNGLDLYLHPHGGGAPHLLKLGRYSNGLQLSRKICERAPCPVASSLAKADVGLSGADLK